jgi:Fe-S-cluster containining protein
MVLMLIDFEGFVEQVTKELKGLLPSIDEATIKQEVTDFVLATDLDPRLGERYAHLCERHGHCCMDCPELMGNICEKHASKPEICKLYPIWKIKDECGIYPAMDCSLAFKIVKYELLNKLR